MNCHWIATPTPNVLHVNLKWKYGTNDDIKIIKVLIYFNRYPVVVEVDTLTESDSIDWQNEM